MKISKSQLMQIIKEEVSRALRKTLTQEGTKKHDLVKDPVGRKLRAKAYSAPEDPRYSGGPGNDKDYASDFTGIPGWESGREEEVDDAEDLFEEEDDSFSKAGEEIEKKGTEGVFTKKAKDAGMGVQAFAKKVLAKDSDYSTKTKRQAAFAKGAETVAKNRKKK